MKTCNAAGCTATTRSGKPYCIEHVELNPHARRVAAELAHAGAEGEPGFRS